MKRKNTYAFTALLVLSLNWTACVDFEALNTNPTKSSTADPNGQLTFSQLLTWGSWVPNYTNFAYCSSFAQHLQGEWNATQYGGQYRRSNEILAHAWNTFYMSPIKELTDVLYTTEGNPIQRNVRAAARIFRVYFFMTLTDLYGDLPYFGAGKGYWEGEVSPAYDSQEAIYLDFLKELKEAAEAFDDAGGTLTGDIVFKGDLNKWRRFANALRLRAAMRMVYAAPAVARSEVIDILSSDHGLPGASENAYVEYLDINDWASNEYRRNALSQSWRSRETYPSQFISSVLWNHLVNTEDPRLFRLCRAYQDTASAANNPFGRLDLTDDILQNQGIGKFQPVDPGYFWYTPWPSGYWSVQTDSWQDKACRPQINNAFLRGDTPGILITYAEIQLLLAEAKVRWGEELPGLASAATLYTDGVTAAMDLLTLFRIDPVTGTELSGYLQANGLPSASEEALKAINEQLWILHFNNPPEAYTNWRRSGYPLLKSSREYGVITIESQEIPRRLNYPLSEASYNSQAYEAALAKMGGTDNWNAKVWWDKK